MVLDLSVKKPPKQKKEKRKKLLKKSFCIVNCSSFLKGFYLESFTKMKHFVFEFYLEPLGVILEVLTLYVFG